MVTWTIHTRTKDRHKGSTMEYELLSRGNAEKRPADDAKHR